jgi:hypothetical protein
MTRFSGLALIAALLGVAAGSVLPFSSDPVQVVFDLPLTVECRDVSPAGFAEAHPTLKVIEGTFRISARIVAGSESDVADFLYFVVSPDKKMRFQDYLPNTALESAVAEDQIEITDTTETTKGGEIGAKVGYQGVGGGLSRSKSTRKVHTSHYKEIAAQALVVASGTTDHEHGIFFKLKPSRAASLEGAKAFTFLATVPKSWRGGWCTISCGARAKSNTWFARGETVPAGVAQSQVGLYLSGDIEANVAADNLADAQRRHADALEEQLGKERLLESMYEAAASGPAASLCGVFSVSPRRWKSGLERGAFERGLSGILDAQEQLRGFSE